MRGFFALKEQKQCLRVSCIRLSSEWLRVALLQVKFHTLWPAWRLFTIFMSLKRKRSVLSVKDKNEVADNIVFQKALFHN